jgi:peptidoglycan/xylan/chitin deacetylase (PgdA/CDA1 family)
VSTRSVWPAGARAAVSVTVDNLGEAAEIDLGLREPDAPQGDHYSVTTALPIMLDTLAAAGLSATFFVEGVNAETYPHALASIAEAGHELGYHAWCHEDWSTLDARAEAANLDRGLAALRAIGIEAVGFRPPGGRITPRTLDLLARRGLRHCSPAGGSPGIDRVVVLPFAWPAVDVFHVLPAFAALRQHLTQDGNAGGADAVRAALLGSVEDALAGGGHATLVLHTWMIELELDAVRDVLARVREAHDAGELWAAPCRDVAAWMTEHPARFGHPPRLDQASWTTPS